MTTDEARAEAVLRTVASIEPRALDRTAWDAIVERSSRPEVPWRLIPAFAISVLLGIGGVLLVQRNTSVVEPMVVPSPVVVVEAKTQWVQSGDGVLHLQHGPMTVRDEKGPSLLALVTPHLALSASHAVFLAEVIGDRTRVAVDEGTVEVRSGTMHRRLKANERFEWPVLPESLLAPAEIETSCSDFSCLESESRGSSLDAQSALYELGSMRAHEGDLEGALSAWRSSLRRFPQGVLAPEVRIATFVQLVSAGRFIEARAMADELERCCAEDPRTGDVKRAVSALPR